MFYDGNDEPFYEEKDFMEHVCPKCQPLVKFLFKSFRSSIAGMHSGLKKYIRENREKRKRENSPVFGSEFWRLDGEGIGLRDAYDAFRRSVHYLVWLKRVKIEKRGSGRVLLTNKPKGAK